ncbi:sensor histidine kinase [Paenibacillus thermotolerans]|uniref:sensor histidine kinase n=1 Tax=Paenibacillus thermotolerans TaxID=3027807 RepID=UPI002367525D|nr:MULTISPECIES: histidine kinase [unclassified Paenibacillus]
MTGSRLLKRMRSLSIVKKMALGYIFIIIIPIVSFGLFLYNQNYNRILHDYAQGRQKIVDQVAANLKVGTVQIESVYNLFQYNSNVINYLSGRYRTDFDQVNNFLTYIRPLFSYIQSSNLLIADATIYHKKQNSMVFRTEMADIDEFPYDPALTELPLGIGKWVSFHADGGEPGINLHYFRKIGNRNYEQEIGLLDITVDSGMIVPLLESLNKGGTGNIYVLDQDNNELYFTEATPLSKEQKQLLFQKASERSTFHEYQTFNRRLMLVQSFYSDGLKLRFVVIEQLDDVFDSINKNKYVLAVTVSVLLLLLSGIYYMIALSMTKRILKLSRHMRQVNESNFPLYRGEIIGDEVGQLTASYNTMISRMDELINTVHRSELMRKEAAYRMMQAQIKPHFLYNTLESIRMIADANDDHEAADMAYTLGKLFRYSLSSLQEETSLKEEIENSKDYVKIQQIRMGDRLQVSFDIAAPVDRFVCPRFILQPIVENSIAHGIAKVRKQGHLTVRVYEDSEYVYVAVEDTGAGIPEERLRAVRNALMDAGEVHTLQSERGGLGLSNVNERIKMFYGKQSGIRIDSVPGEGTVCTLQLYKGETP